MKQTKQKTNTFLIIIQKNFFNYCSKTEKRLAREEEEDSF
jgi:hypothetical protein